MVNNIKSSLMTQTKINPKIKINQVNKKNAFKEANSVDNVNLSDKAKKLHLKEQLSKDKIENIKHKIAKGEYEINVENLAEKVFNKF